MISSSFEFCFEISFCNQVHELSIIKISVEARALLCCYDLEEVERIKEFILILWFVMKIVSFTKDRPCLYNRFSCGLLNPYVP